MRKQKITHSMLISDPSAGELSYGVSAEEKEQMQKYLSYGGMENFRQFWCWLAKAYCQDDIPVKEPKALLWQGIYHPRAERPFTDLAAYRAAFCQTDRPTIGLLFYRDEWVWGDLAYQAALVEEIVADRIGQVRGSEALPPTVSLPDMQRSADQITAAMLTGINQNNYTRFSENFDQKMKNTLAETQFRLLSQSIKQKLGKYVSQEPVTAEQKENFTIFTYKVKFEKEKAAITVRTVLTQEDARLLVAGFWMDAPM